LLYDYLGFPRSAKTHFKWIVNCTSVPSQIRKKQSNEKLSVVFIGRNSVEKRPHLVFKIIERIRKQTNEIQFSFVGDFENKVLYDVKFYGVVYDKEKMDEIFNGHQVLLLTSVSEGFPMVIMEAMAHGLVPVSTPVGDIPLHVTNDRGVMLDNVSEEAVVESACKVLLNLLHEKDKLQLMGMNSYLYAKESFSVERFRADYLKLF
jgi:glycosyltransferase involved in cell wall biosynthesis